MSYLHIIVDDKYWKLIVVKTPWRCRDSPPNTKESAGTCIEEWYSDFNWQQTEDKTSEKHTACYFRMKDAAAIIISLRILGKQT